jgi:alpha-tubulin suppressor-like RCC1 family protein
MKECKPRIVEAFEEKDENGKVIEEKRVKIMYVSCGAFHTLCTSDKGQVFSFGQNKYGKLGIHRQKAKEG